MTEPRRREMDALVVEDVDGNGAGRLLRHGGQGQRSRAFAAKALGLRS
jgi:hypothetical protein